MESLAYKLGQHDFKEGCDWDENPYDSYYDYDMHIPEYYQWNEGWWHEQELQLTFERVFDNEY